MWVLYIPLLSFALYSSYMHSAYVLSSRGFPLPYLTQVQPLYFLLYFIFLFYLFYFFYFPPVFDIRFLSTLAHITSPNIPNPQFNIFVCILSNGFFFLSISPKFFTMFRRWSHCCIIDLQLQQHVRHQFVETDAMPRNSLPFFHPGLTPLPSPRH